MGGDIRLFPPTLDGTNYAVWKVRIEAYSMGKKHEVWSMMVNGVDKEHEKFTKEEMEFNGSAKNIIFASISDNLFHQVSSCPKAKEMWDKLKTIHEGTQQQKDNQVGILVNDFELFKQRAGESIRDLVGRMNALINALKNMGKTYSTLELNRKLLNALSNEWKIKVIAIEEAKNLTTTPLEEIVGSLLTHEMNEARRSEGVVRKDKSIAFQAQESSSEEDEDVAMLSRKIARMLRSRRKFGNTSKICYECRKPGHFKDECPNLKKKEDKERKKEKPSWKRDKKNKVLKATWSDSSGSEDHEEVEGEKATEEANLCLMANSSEGEVSFEVLSNEELIDALADLLSTYKIVRKDLKRKESENSLLLEKISVLNEQVENALCSPQEESEYIRKLENENTRLEIENTALKNSIESLNSESLRKEETMTSPFEHTQTREIFNKFVGSQKILEMLLGRPRSFMGKEGLGYNPDDAIGTNKGTTWVKERNESQYPKSQGLSRNAELNRKVDAHRKYLVDKRIQYDTRYRYSHSFGMLGDHTIIDRLVDPIVNRINEPPRVEPTRLNLCPSPQTSNRKQLSRDTSRLIHTEDKSRAYVHHPRMIAHPQFMHPHTVSPYPVYMSPSWMIRRDYDAGVPLLPPWFPWHGTN